MVQADDLAGFALLGNVPGAQLDRLAALASSVTHRAGTRIFAESDPADACWLIRSGRVAVQTDTVSPTVTLQTLGPGDILGWSWLVPPYRWQFTAVAVEPVDALRLDGERLRRLTEADPALGYALAVQLLQVVADRLSSTRARLLDLYRNPRER